MSRAFTRGEPGDEIGQCLMHVEPCDGAILNEAREEGLAVTRRQRVQLQLLI